MRTGLFVALSVALMTPAMAIASVPASARAQGMREIGYGGDPFQRLDFYPAARANAPLVVFVHGGGWSKGDKRNATGAAKIAHFRAKGYAFATINYRLVPGVQVEDQAQDVAVAVATLAKQARELGIDPSRIVLMGHSAGAHLSALVGTDPRYFAKAGFGVERLAGVILLDGAAYDVPVQMRDGPRIMSSTYSAAFGSDPARQRAVSPTLQAAAPNAPAFLILHVDRADGRRQSVALTQQLQAAGARVTLQEIAGSGLMGHMQINRSLGDADYPATAVVDRWIEGVLREPL